MRQGHDRGSSLISEARTRSPAAAASRLRSPHHARSGTRARLAGLRRPYRRMAIATGHCRQVATIVAASATR